MMTHVTNLPLLRQEWRAVTKDLALLLWQHDLHPASAAAAAAAIGQRLRASQE